VIPRRHAREVEQLAALLDGSRAPHEVGREARRLGAIATAVIEREPFEAVTLSPANREAMRARLLADIANGATETAPAPAPSREPRRVGTRSFRLGVATGLASAVVGTTGVAFAAQEALPGEALYRVKQATESARLSLAGDVTQHGRLQLKFAEERLDEVSEGRDRLTSTHLVAALADMDQRSLDGAEALIAEAGRRDDGQLLAELDAFTQRQAATLVEIYDELPPQVRPHAEDSLGMLRWIRLELLFPAIQACDCVELAETGVLPVGESTSLAERLRSAALPAPVPGLELPRLSDGLSGAAAEAVERVERAGEPSPSSAEQPTVSTTPGTTGTGSGTVGEITDTLGEVVEETTDGTGDVIEETTEVVGGDLGDTLDDTVDDVGGSVGGVVEDPVGGVGDVLDDPLGGVGDAVGGVTGGVEDLGSGLGLGGN
jgi:hypothetical protein